MKIFIFFIMCIWIFDIKRIFCMHWDSNSKLNSYLKRKSTTLQVTFFKSRHELSKRGAPSIEFEETENPTYQGKLAGDGTVTFFEENHIPVEEDVLAISRGTDQETYFNAFHNLKRDPGNQKFTRVTYYNKTLITLQRKQVGEAHIFGKRKSSFFIQTLLVPVSTDARFFVWNGDLYLIVVNNIGDNMALTVVYKWLGSHFDEIDAVITVGAIKVTSFSTNTSEILIILQHLQDRMILSDAYEFKMDLLKKIQHVRTENPINVNTYVSRHKRYVIVFEESRKNTIHFWNGYQLVRVGEFESETIVKKYAICTSNDTSILVIPTTDRLQVYRLSSESVILEGEKQLSSNYSTVTDIYCKDFDGLIKTLITGYPVDGELKMEVIRFKTNFVDKEISSEEKNTLRQCFNNLEHKVYEMRNQINESQSKIQLPTDVTDSGVEEDFSGAILSDDLKLETDIEKDLNDIKLRLESVNSFLNNYTSTHANTLVVNGNLTVEGSVKSDELTGKNIKIKTANRHKWVPEQWLKYEEPQTITGLVKLNNIVAKTFETTPNDPLVKDLLLKNGNQTITGSMSIGNLKANGLYTGKINDIPMEKVFIKSNPQPIKGVKTFKKLDVDELKVQVLNNDEPGKVLPLIIDTKQSKMNFDSNVAIDDLEVETINGINWDDFVDSVFRIGKDSHITGPLSFPTLKAVRVNLNKLKGMAIADFLTTSTDQTIQSNVEFNRIFAKNISAKIVNNINLLESAVTMGQNDSIKTPVTFEKLNVVKDLKIAGNLDDSLFWKVGDHIIGTSESDLFQQYRGKVKIKGNLRLSDLYLQPKIRLVVSGKQIGADLERIYWTKDTVQEINTHVTALQGLSTPHVLTNMLNDIKFGQYMLNNNDDRLETDYHFEKISVKGNVILRNTADHQPNINKIGKEAIKTNGSFIIDGRKTYEDTLKAENLATLKLGGIDTLDVLTTKHPANVTGIKIFQDVIVLGNVNSSHIDAPIINDELMEDFIPRVVFIDQPRNISSLHFVDLNVTDLLVSKLNGYTIDEYVLSSNKLSSSITRIENLIVKGNFTVKNIWDLSTINNVPFDDILDNAPKRGEFGGLVGDVRFTGKVTVGNLATSFLNDMDLENITKRFLFRQYNQTIRAPYRFGKIKTENIITSKINDIDMDTLIDVSSKEPQVIHSPNSLRFTEAVFNSVEAKSMTPCMISDLLTYLKDPPSRTWSEVRIKGNVTLLDNENVLYRILENSVKTNTKNVINSPVKFSGRVKAEHITTRKSINDVDLAEIFNDAVLSDSNDLVQSITGKKLFNSIQAKTAKVLRNANIRYINGEAIPDLDELIVDKHQIDRTVIKGKKTFFSGLQTNRIQTKSISNLEPQNIVQVGSARKVPSATFESFEVENDLNITFFNNINFQEVLKNRLLIGGVVNQTSRGTLFFENLEAENLFTTRINNIKIENIVFDAPNQTISSMKRFKKKVEVFGSIITDSINGIPISEEFSKSVRLGEPVSINGSMRVLRPSHLFGDVDAESINGHLVSEIKEILNNSNIKTEVQEIYDLKDQIIGKIHRNIDAVQALPGEYMYLEKSDELQISVQNTVSASTAVSNGYVLFHVTGYESGEYCGLPEYCPCPQQLTVEISPEHSVTTFPNKGLQRSFSYDDESMIVYFTTNSVSTSYNCSSASSRVMNEMSLLTWNTKSTSNSTGLFYQYDTLFTGHISKVEFFTLEKATYVIIGRFYDPIYDSYDLDCTVIKFNENRTAATEIQKISTKAVQELHLFHTAQGVVLIIGNTRSFDKHSEEDETQILRFDPVKERFVVLRTIPSFGCTDATGVVFGSDSLIILAHKLAPIQVLKYYPDFDNYYFYQSFELDEPVIGVTTFYIGGFGMSDAYLCVITENENYFIYEFRFLEGWQLKSRGELEGLRNFVPFELNKKSYIFAPSSKISSLLTVVKNGSN